jgi:hypothetical protein
LLDVDADTKVVVCQNRLNVTHGGRTLDFS